VRATVHTGLTRKADCVECERHSEILFVGEIAGERVQCPDGFWAVAAVGYLRGMHSGESGRLGKVVVPEEVFDRESFRCGRAVGPHCHVVGCQEGRKGGGKVYAAAGFMAV